MTVGDAKRAANSDGFTLLEMSIVLVIIGLIVGGILVGQDLIHASEVRATISQLEAYQSAVNTFRGKYGYLPGDIPAAPAAQFGFAARGLYAGEGDGNGLIEGVDQDVADVNSGHDLPAGETGMFWRDLSTVSLIDGSFTTAQSNGPFNDISETQLAAYFPAAKLGHGLYIMVFSGGTSGTPGDGINYYALAAPYSVQGGVQTRTRPIVRVRDAYNIDAKLDDGLPQSGRVSAVYLSSFHGVPFPVGPDSGARDTSTASPPDATTCYDDGGVTGAPRHYSISRTMERVPIVD